MSTHTAPPQPAPAGTPAPPPSRAAVPAPPPPPPREAERLHIWTVQAHQHEVAHAQISTRAERSARWTNIVAAILAVFTGAAWTTDLAKTSIVPSTTIQWVAAMAAFASALLVAITTASNWKPTRDDHTADKKRWQVVEDDLADLDFDPDGLPDVAQLKQLKADRKDARDNERNITARDLDRAGDWLTKNRPWVMAPDEQQISRAWFDQHRENLRQFDGQRL